MKYQGYAAFVVSLILLVPALILVHRQEVVAMRREAERWQNLFDDTSNVKTVTFKVYLGVGGGGVQPVGSIRRSVVTDGDNATMTTALLPLPDQASGPMAIRFSQESIVRKNIGLVTLSADIGLGNSNFTVNAERQGETFSIIIESGGHTFEKRLPVSTLGAAGSGSIMSYLSPFDEHPGDIVPGGKLYSWELDPLTFKVKRIDLTVGQFETITLDGVEVEALPVKSHRQPPAIAWYTPDGILLKESLPLAKWLVVLERVIDTNE